MMQLAERRTPIDLTTLSNALDESGELERVGGRSYLAKLIDGVPRNQFIEPYCKIIKGKAIRRRALALSQELQRAAFDDVGDDFLDSATRATSALQKILVSPVENGLRFKGPDEICADAGEQVRWILEGFIAEACITEVSGPAKLGGKTTLSMGIVASVLEGKRFAGLRTTRTNVCYLTEERNQTFAKSIRKSGLQGYSKDRFSVLQWNDARGASWRQIVQSAVAECRRISGRGLWIDTLPRFTQLPPEASKDDGYAREVMGPLEEAAAEGLAIVVIRHERKAGGAIGQAAAGSVQYTHLGDVILSVRRPDDNGLGRNARIITATGRFDEIPETFIVELTDNGFVAVDPIANSRENAEQDLLDVMPKSEGDSLTASELLKATSLRRTQAYNALEGLQKTGHIVRTGTGKKGNPFRYHRDPNSIRPPIEIYRGRTNPPSSSSAIRPNGGADEYQQIELGVKEGERNSSVENSSTDELSPVCRTEAANPGRDRQWKN